MTALPHHGTGLVSPSRLSGFARARRAKVYRRAPLSAHGKALLATVLLVLLTTAAASRAVHAFAEGAAITAPQPVCAGATDTLAAQTAANALNPTAVRTAYVLVSEGSWLNIREQPKAHAAITLRLTRGDAVSVYSVTRGGWVEISRAGDPGYCRVEYLTDAPPADPADYVATVRQLKVRALPNGKVLRKLKRGETVTVLGWFTDSNGDCWATLENGFVLARYLAAEENAALASGQKSETANRASTAAP